MDEVHDDRIDELERRVDRLEAELAAMRAKPGAVAVTTKYASPVAAQWPAPTVNRLPVAQQAARTARERFTVDSEVVLKWGGVGLVVLAVGFAVSTAISRGWIGPELQLAGALAVSLGLVGGGLRLQSSRPAWTHALCAAGVVAAFTTVASNLFRDQAGDRVAFWSTVLIGAAGFVLARHVPSEWTAAATLVGGVVGWLVIIGDDFRVAITVIWFAALVAAAIGLALENGWFAVRAVAHVAGMFVMLPLAGESAGAIEHVLVVTAAALLAASMFWVPSVGAMTSIFQQLEVQLSIALAPWAFGVVALVSDLDGDAPVGLVAIGVAATTAALAIGLRRRLKHPHFVSLLIGASIATSIGAAIVLSATVAVVALAVQAAGLVVLSRALDNSVRVLVNAGIVAVFAVQRVLIGLIDAWSDGAPWGDDLAHAAIITALGVGGWQTRQRRVRQATGLGVLALLLFWLGSVLVHLPQGQAAVSVSWALVGTALLVAGAVRKVPEHGVVGLAVLGLTVAKLLTVDLRAVDTLWRAGLFFVVGLGFLRLGFLLPRLTGGRPRPDDDTGPG